MGNAHLRAIKARKGKCHRDNTIVMGAKKTLKERMFSASKNKKGEKMMEVFGLESKATIIGPWRHGAAVNPSRCKSSVSAKADSKS